MMETFCLTWDPIQMVFIEPNQVQRLKELGEWTKANAEAIYGTRGGPYLPTKDIVSTNKGKSIYLHIVDEKNQKKNIIVKNINAKVKSCTTMDGKDLNFEVKGDNIYITLDENKVGVEIIKLAINKEAFNLPLIENGEEFKHNVNTNKKVLIENVKEN